MKSCESEIQANGLIENQLRELEAREFQSFMTWMKEKWEGNPPALLCTNPPDQCFDEQDGDMPHIKRKGKGVPSVTSLVESCLF
jgi:hypothetical protein